MERLLVVRGGALGDFVLGLPALRALRDAFPDSTLELVAPGAVLPLAASLVDVATPIERSEVAALFGDSDRLPQEIDVRYRDLDLVVLWLADADGSVRRSFERLAAGRVLWAPAIPPAGRHATDHLLETLRPLRIPPSVPAGPSRAFRQSVPDTVELAAPATSPDTVEPASPSTLAGSGATLPPRNRCGPVAWAASSCAATPPSTVEGSGLLTDPGGRPLVRPRVRARDRAVRLWRELRLPDDRAVVALHPGSGGDWKRWPADRFAQVASRLARCGLAVVVIQGPADEGAIREVLSFVEGSEPPVAAGLDVEELAAFLSHASCYLGNDSGVTHLAAAVGIPTVAIFGPTDPAMWSPRGPRVLVLRGDGRCAACGRDRAPGCEVRACLSDVAVEQAVAAIEGMVSGQ